MRAALGLDSGYLSRLLRALTAEGLVEVVRGQGDARVRRVALTAKGRAELAAYERLSDELARSILAPLASPERERLLAAMAEVERLLSAGAVVVALEPADLADARLVPRPAISPSWRAASTPASIPERARRSAPRR